MLHRQIEECFDALRSSESLASQLLRKRFNVLRLARAAFFNIFTHMMSVSVTPNAPHPLPQSYCSRTQGWDSPAPSSQACEQSNAQMHMY